MAGWRTLFHMPFLMALGVGVCLNNAKAVLEAITSSISRKPSEFVRTPKYGVTGANRQRWRSDSVFTFKRLSLPIIEIAFGLYMSACLYLTLTTFYYFPENAVGLAAVPFLVIFAGGYFYVGFTSIYALWKMQQERQEALDAAEAAEPAST